MTRAVQHSHNLQKGDLVTLEITSLAQGGDGLSKDLGIPVFISRTAPGDVVEALLFDVRKDFARGQVVSIIKPSDKRMDAPCKLFKVCGGCQWQHMEYQYQLQAKQDIVRQSVKFIGRQDPDLVLPTIAAYDSFNYRNKVQFPVRQVKSTGRILAGYYKENSHELVNVKHCPVQPTLIDEVMETCKSALEAHNVDAYDEDSDKGFLKHITARYSFAQGKVVVAFVANTLPAVYPELTHLQSNLVVSEHDDPIESFAAQKYSAKLAAGRTLNTRGVDQAVLKAVAEEIMSAVPSVQGVALNFNPFAGNRIYGATTAVLKGDVYLQETLAADRDDYPQRLQEGIKFRLAPTSFFQVNSKTAVRLLEIIADCIMQTSAYRQSKSIPFLIDAYAGVGTMALWLAPLCEKIVAIEEFAPAVEDGRVNCNLNDIKNVEFREGKAEDILAKLAAAEEKPSLVLVDPPRKGLNSAVISALAKSAVPAIIYVSCNPATLARDLKLLAESGYKTTKIQPIDMFPQTFHVETVTMLEKV